jgi:uncharacterized lipoprotein NlpE involved in copper resistance
MKNTIISAIAMAFVLISCNQKSKESETTNAPVMEHDSTMTMKDSTMMVKDSTATDKVYACPMHPEAKGKLNDKCPKCGMKLTVEVK